MRKTDDEHLKFTMEQIKQILEKFPELDPNDIIGFFRLNHILALFPYGRSTLYALIKSGDFPEGVCIGSRIRVWPKLQILTILRDLDLK